MNFWTPSSPLQMKQPLLILKSMYITFHSTPSHLSTYWHMKGRQWSRLYRATYTKSRVWSYKFVTFYLLLYVTYLIVFIYNTPDPLEERKIMEYVVMGILTLTLGYISPSFGWFFRILLVEIYIGLILFFVLVNDNIDNYFFCLVIYLGGVIFLTAIDFLFYPIMLRAWFSLTGNLSPQITVSEGQGRNGEKVLRYEIEESHLLTSNTKCVYEGPLLEGKPHGFGVWVDTSYQGDLLKGYFSHGIPVGPFQSVETDTGNILVNLRIIYGSNGGGEWSLHRTDLTVGVASVETCVSGKFFKGYPMVTYLTDPISVIDNLDHVKKIFDKKFYLHPDEEKGVTSVTVNIAQDRKLLNITGFVSLKNTPKSVTITLKQDKDQNKEQNSENRADKRSQEE
eukprot:TRINITY_DN3918_c0_g2_i3.p1 TRINITY_DN3918_c0_g2~~TRINITY_DN3918_c0_g2_i3.p1  ORF type:complete len:395 (+),score=38.92 TRINITY_DN3918_c0_g2_i3:157-1341(+)